MNEKHNPRSTPPYGVTIWVWDITDKNSVPLDGIPPLYNDRPTEAKLAPVWVDYAMGYYIEPTNKLLWWHTKEECARYMVDELRRQAQTLATISERMTECAADIEREHETP